MSPQKLRIDDIIEKGFQHSNYVLQRICGYPSRDGIQLRDNVFQNCCPYCKVIRKYIPSFQKTVSMVVPCGKCLICQHHKQNQLIYRMYNHNKVYKNCIYVTLTYNNEHYCDNPDVCRDDITKFIKRLRKQLCDRTFSYYLVCERGDLRNRLHFHLLLWWNGLAPVEYVCNLVRSCWYAPLRDLSKLSDVLSDVSMLEKLPSSPIGIVYIDTSVNTSNSSSIASYISKYVSDNIKKVMFRSWSHGLGLDILSIDDDLVQKFSFLRSIQYMPKDKLYTIGIPKYYYNKIFKKSVRDCYFYDYLMSDYASKMLDYVKDDHQRQVTMANYMKYEERAINAYRLKCAKKAKDKLLL